MAKGATIIMVIRHAEKPDKYQGKHYDGVDATGASHKDALVTLGWQRAGALNTLFAPPWGPRQPALARPTAIYAADPAADKGKEPSQRPFETVSPLAALLGLAIDTKHEKSDYAKVVTDALTKNGPVLICWQHEDIVSIGQEILEQTGTTGIAIPASWPVGTDGVARYDLVWVFSRPSGTGPIAGFAQFAQMLLAGDTTAPA